MHVCKYIRLFFRIYKSETCIFNWITTARRRYYYVRAQTHRGIITNVCGVRSRTRRADDPIRSARAVGFLSSDKTNERQSRVPAPRQNRVFCANFYCILFSKSKRRGYSVRDLWRFRKIFYTHIVTMIINYYSRFFSVNMSLLKVQRIRSQ